VAGEAGVGREPFGAGGAADDDRGGDGAAGVFGEQLGALSFGQRFELDEQLAFLTVDLRPSDPKQINDGLVVTVARRRSRRRPP
jgi:hypothetical protein